jgi:hypothetical protein
MIYIISEVMPEVLIDPPETTILFSSSVTVA